MASPLLALALAFLDPAPAPETPPCLIAQLYFDGEAFDVAARTMLDRAVRGRRQATTILIHASGMRSLDGMNRSGERSLQRGNLVRDHLVAGGHPADRIRVIGQDEGARRFGNPGDGVVLVMVEYGRARIGATVTGYTHHASGCSTPVRRPTG